MAENDYGEYEQFGEGSGIRTPDEIGRIFAKYGRSQSFEKGSLTPFRFVCDFQKELHARSQDIQRKQDSQVTTRQAQPQGLVALIASYFKLIPPCYYMGFSQGSEGDESKMVHKGYFPVVTSIKKVQDTGKSGSDDIIEIRRAIIFKNFFNVFPSPEEVIRIDRSKINSETSPNEVVLESYIDYGYKIEQTKLLHKGVFLRQQLLMDLAGNRAL